MNLDPARPDLLICRQTVRRRALANLLLILLDTARATAGRLAVKPLVQDAVLLAYQDVRTLVQRGRSFRLETRDFAIALACPALWPFDRAAALVPYVLAPDDFAHPNSDGHGLCVDLAGVWPQDVPALLYDNVRLHRYRLDHCVDPHAADFVRAHLADFPANPRPLYPEGRVMTALELARATLCVEGCVCAPGEGGGLVFCGPLGRGRIDPESSGFVRLWYDLSAVAGDPIAVARIASRMGPARITLRRRAPVAERTCSATEIGTVLRGMARLGGPQEGEVLPVLDVAVGVLSAAAPRLSAPTFLRLALTSTTMVDRARATYLLIANAQLRAGSGGWREGGGLAVDPRSADPAVLAEELRAVSHAIDALGDESIARSYLELNGMQLSGPTRAPSGAP